MLIQAVGSDILAHKSACNEDGVVLPDARDQVFQRTQEYFPPELLNRLDSMVVFNKLSKKSILQVVSLRLNDIAERLKTKRITLDVDKAAQEWLANQGYSELYGARAIARVVRTDVLFPLAQRLLKGTIRDGDVVIIRVGEDGSSLNIKDNHSPDPNASEVQITNPTWPSFTTLTRSFDLPHTVSLNNTPHL